MIFLIEVSGIINENAYFFVDDRTNHGFLIDPGAQADRLLKFIVDKRFVIEKILLTHGHFDHIGAVNEIQNALRIPVCMSKNGIQYAKNPIMNGSRVHGQNILLNEITLVDDNEEICLSDNEKFNLKLIPAPGHTLDGAIYYNAENSVAFVGDTIFYRGYGRTDLLGGNEIDLMDTIKNKILKLPNDTKLFPGHGSPTTVAKEKMRAWYL